MSSHLYKRTAIPLTIHQLWIDNSNPDRDPPSQYDEWRDSVYKCNSNVFSVRTWKKEEVLELLEQPILKRFREMYTSLPSRTQSDLARFLIIFTVGGLYLDVRMSCRRCLYPLLDRYKDNEILIVKEPAEHQTEGKERLSTLFMAGVPHHRFFFGMLEYIHGKWSRNRQNHSFSVPDLGDPKSFHDYYSQCGIESGRYLIKDAYVLPLTRSGKLTAAASEMDRDLHFTTPHWEWRFERYGNSIIEGFSVGAVALILIVILIVIVTVLYQSNRSA